MKTDFQGPFKTDPYSGRPEVMNAFGRASTPNQVAGGQVISGVKDTGEAVVVEAIA